MLVVCLIVFDVGLMKIDIVLLEVTDAGRQSKDWKDSVSTGSL
jgi:hypothetical protein